MIGCKTYLNITYLTAPTEKGGDECFKDADMLSQLLIETCPAIVTAAPLSCNAGNGLLHIDPKNNSCASAARAIKNLASGVVGNEVGDIDCVDERYFQVRDSTRCPETADAINTVLQFHAGDLPLDYEECNDPTTQTTTATTTVATNAEETQCAFASWQSKMLMVKCNDYNTRWINRLLQICGVAGGGKLTCLGGKLTSATPELCGSHVEMLNQIVRDVSYNANPLHAPFRCAAGGKKVAHTTQDTDACSVDVRLLGKAGHLLLTDQYDGCSHNTQTSTETTTATSTVESTATTTAASTKTTTATSTATTGRRCNGKPEAPLCAALSESDCNRIDEPINIFASCPILCGTCTSSTTTTTTPVCNGISDPTFCETELSGACGTITSDTNINVNMYCPVMCGSCVPSTSTTTATATTSTETSVVTETLDPLVLARTGGVDILCADFSGQQVIAVVAERADQCHYQVAKPFGIAAQGCVRGFPDPESLIECHAASSNNGYLLYGGGATKCMETAVAIGAGLRSNGITAVFGCTSDGYLTMPSSCTEGMMAVAMAAARSQQKVALANPQPAGQPALVDANRDCTHIIGDNGAIAFFYFRQDLALSQLVGVESEAWKADAFKEALAKSLQSKMTQVNSKQLSVLDFSTANGEIKANIPAPGSSGGSASGGIVAQLELLVTSVDNPFTFLYGGTTLTSSSVAHVVDGASAGKGPPTGIIIVLALIAVLMVGVIGMLVSLQRSRKVGPDYLVNHNPNILQKSVWNEDE